MRKTDESRSRCHPVATEAETGLPLGRNGEQQNDQKVTVN
jgi:hypothetical protein